MMCVIHLETHSKVSPAGASTVSASTTSDIMSGRAAGGALPHPANFVVVATPRPGIATKAQVGMAVDRTMDAATDSFIVCFPLWLFCEQPVRDIENGD